MREPVTVFVSELGAFWMNQLSAHKREQASANGGALDWRQELGDRSTVKAPALDGGTLEKGTLARLEPVDARCEERLQTSAARRARLPRRRPPAALQAAARRRGGFPRPPQEPVRAGRSRECAALEAGVDQRFNLGLGERLEEKELRGRPSFRQRRARLEQLGPCAGEQQDRAVGAEGGDVLDEVEKGRLGPMKVFEDDDEWALTRETPPATCARPSASRRSIRADRQRRRQRQRAQQRDHRSRFR